MTSREQGMAALRAGDASGALPHLFTAVRDAPDDSTAWGGLGIALCQLQRGDEGIRALETAVSLAPPHPALVYNLGRGLELLGRAEEARAAYRRALALDIRHAPSAAAGRRLAESCLPHADSALLLQEQEAAAAQPAAAPVEAVQVVEADAPAGVAAGEGAPDTSGETGADGTERAADGPAELPASEASAPRAPARPAAGALPVAPRAPWAGVPRALAGTGAALALGLVMAAALFSWPGRSVPGGRDRGGFYGAPRVSDPMLGFSVTFPGGYPEPQKTETAAPTGTGQTVGFTSIGSTGECFVVSSEYPGPVLDALGVEGLSRAMRAGLGFEHTGAVQAQPVRHAGHAAQESRFRALRGSGPGFARMRLVIARPRVFLVGCVMENEAEVNSPAVTRFFESLQISKEFRPAGMRLVGRS